MRYFYRPLPLTLSLAAAVFAAMFCCATSSPAQESVRISMAGTQAAEARRSAASTPGYYNLKLGPSKWRLSAGLEAGYDSNIRLNSVDPKGDGSFSPSLEANMICPLSGMNNLNLTFGGGYQAYTRYSEYNHGFINPGSQLSFDIYTGDFWINFHDRFSITKDNYQDPTVVGSGDYSQLQNDAGADVVWDINHLVMRLSYDHLNYIVLSGDPGQPDARQEVFTLAGGYELMPGSEAGLELGGGMMHYDYNTNDGATTTNTLYTDATQWSLGPYVGSRVTEYIQVHFSAGYAVYTPDTPQLENLSGAYGQLELAHRINKYLFYHLSGGRSINFALFGGTVDLYTARWVADWNVLRGFTLSTGFTYEHGEQLTSYQENFDRFGASLSLGRQIMKNMAATLGYQYYNRLSDLPDHDYIAHEASINLRYRF